jgi:hypothetical protein
MNVRSSSRPLSLILLIASVMIGLAISAPAQSYFSPSPLYAPNANVFGMSYGEWTAAWWQYVLAYPASTGPYSDTTGTLCNLGQGGPVLFLVGGPVNPTVRRCTIPGGKALFLPLINVECSNLEPAPFHGSNAQETRACVSSWIDGIDLRSLKLTLDGRRIGDLDDYRIQSPLYDFIIPETDNFLGTTGPTAGSSLSDGYWVMFKHLSPGIHVIHFEASLSSGPGAGNTQNVTYVLRVLPH